MPFRLQDVPHLFSCELGGLIDDCSFLAVELDLDAFSGHIGFVFKWEDLVGC